MIHLSHDRKVTKALLDWQAKEAFPTDLGSADLRALSRALRQRSRFAARTTSADFINELGETVDEMLLGKINLADGRLRLMKKLKELGYDPAIGFPADMATVPPAEKDSLQDISSRRRLDLMLETNLRQAQNYGRMLKGNSPAELKMFPAWELVRLFLRDVPRGSPESKTDGWMKRWQKAGERVSWAGALRERMIALKGSPIWLELGEGEDYSDSLGQPYPPFAFNSGMGWRAVPRSECLDLGLPAGAAQPMAGSLTPGQQDWQRALKKLGPNFKAALIAELKGEMKP